MQLGRGTDGRRLVDGLVHEQLTDGDSEGCRKRPQQRHADLSLATLDEADHGPMNTSLMGQLLLRPAACLSK